MSTAERSRRPPRADLMTIGEVLDELRADFPDTTHSKVRFLEERGLVTPVRTPSGYRKFSPDHLARLRLVLTLQRERYLPLKVIAQHLAALDAGVAPPALPAYPDASPRPPTAPGCAPPADRRRATAAPEPEPEPEPEPGEPSPVARERSRAGDAPRPTTLPATTPPCATATPAPLPPATPATPAPAAPPGAPGGAAPARERTFADLVDLAGGNTSLVSALGDHGLLPPAPATRATETVLAAAATLASFGIEPRHLRALRTAAEREAALIEAVAAPLRRAASAPAGADRDAAGAVTGAVAAAFADLRSALLDAALARPR